MRGLKATLDQTGKGQIRSDLGPKGGRRESNVSDLRVAKSFHGQARQ